MNHDFEHKLLPLAATLKDVLRGMCFRPQGIVFFVDRTQRLKAVMTDGDVRRALLRGADIGECAETYFNHNFVFGREEAPDCENIKLFSNKIKYLPILNNHGKIVDILSLTDFCRLPVMEPSLEGNELTYLIDCVRTNWISSQGEYVRRFEEAFADFLGTGQALTTSNGTTALHLALTALNIGRGDEVIVPDLTFAASANTVVHCGAKPIFVDVTAEYWNMDPSLIEKAITNRTKAIMPVHLYGHPCDMNPILEIADRHGLHIVEDCAEALGARYKGQLVGTFGDVGCFSFFSNKVITTGEGGMVLTRDSGLLERMALYRDHGMRKNRRYWHEVAGFNYRMTNLQAAVGLAQIERIDSFLQQRHFMSLEYRKNLKSISGITLPPEMDWAENIHWLFSILVDEHQIGISRDSMMERLAKENIETRPFFHPLHGQPVFFGAQEDFPVSDTLSRQGLSLPSGNDLDRDTLHRISRAIQTLVHGGNDLLSNE